MIRQHSDNTMTIIIIIIIFIRSQSYILIKHDNIINTINLYTQTIYNRHSLLYMYMYIRYITTITTQQMHIRWGNNTTSSFFVSNGVKQGGILSPILFNVYMDQLSVILNASNIGGDIGGVLVNHLCYADDFV